MPDPADGPPTEELSGDDLIDALEEALAVQYEET